MLDLGHHMVLCLLAPTPVGVQFGCWLTWQHCPHYSHRTSSSCTQLISKHPVFFYILFHSFVILFRFFNVLFSSHELTLILTAIYLLHFHIEVFELLVDVIEFSMFWGVCRFHIWQRVKMVEGEGLGEFWLSRS